MSTRVAFGLTALCASVLFFLLGAPTPAHAQFRMRIKDAETVVDATEVEVGDVFHVTLRASSETTRPERPELGPHNGFNVRGPQISTSQMVTNINGRTSMRSGINATWSLQATTPGTFTVGPPSAYVGQTKLTGDPVRIHVVKKGSLAGDPVDPFGGPSTLDPWKSFFGEPQREPALPPPDPALGLDHDDQSPIFLAATLDKTTAFIGEQVTYTVLLYADPEIADQDFITEHEAPAASFLRQSLVADDANSKSLGYGKVRSRIYRVKQVRKVAFFPLSAGNLEIGSEEIRYPLGNRYVSIKTTPVTVNAIEPPTKGRPPGYALGDTGHFELTAEVKPREIDQGDVTSIIVTLTGDGNVPRTALPLPIQKDVSFLQPEIAEKVGTSDRGRFAAVDTFRYVVRIDRDGDVDLGAIELPFFDPDRKIYRVAKAALGVIHVRKADTAKAAPADPNPVVLPDAPAPLASLLGSRPPPAKHISDSGFFWAFLGASPLSYALLRAGGVALASVRRRRKARAESPEAELDRRRAAAKEKANGDDGKALVAAVARYVEEIALARTGVNVKGEPANGVADLLREADVAKAQATEVGALLIACADLAFAPGGVNIEAARALFSRAKDLDAALEKDASA